MNALNTIMLADKDDELLEVLQLFLDRMGYYVIRVNSGKDLLSSLQASPVPVILTSFHLSDMAGIELIKNARKLSPQTEIIVTVDEDDFDSGVISLKYNVSDFITKPIKSDILEVRDRDITTSCPDTEDLEATIDDMQEDMITIRGLLIDANVLIDKHA